MRTSADKRTIRSKRRQPAAAPADTLHARGLAAAAAGNNDLAASLFSQAIQISGPIVLYVHSLARSLRAAGKYRQAAVCYQQALAGEPGNIQLYLELARTLLQDARVAEAIAILKHTLSVQPDVAEGWALLGGALSLAGHSQEALDALSRAIALDSGQAGFHYDMGLVLAQLGESQEAEAAYRRALVLNPKFPDALNNLGNLLRRRTAAAEAVTCYRRAIRHRPGFTEATYNLGLALQDLDLLEDAETCYRNVLTKLPDHHAAKNNLANVMLGLGRIGDALAHYEKASKLAPLNRQYLVNTGIAQLLTGDFRRGWRNYASRPSPSVPGATLWGGESLRGLSILLLSEQGLGDTLQFIRYARHLRYEGGRVRALCPEPLAELLRTVPGLESVTVAGQQPPACDRYAPLMNLPGIFGTALESIPAEMPYLTADPDRVREWGESLVIPRSHLRIGVAWRGGAEHWNDRNRSLDPSHLAGLTGVPDTTWISLQKGFRAGCEFLPFTPLQRELTDFADTAALMTHLDLVISVDTSVAHLAGALARPVWTLLPFAPDWRWLRDRADSPWYPSMTLFRQERRGAWQPVMEKVRQELAKLQSGSSVMRVG